MTINPTDVVVIRTELIGNTVRLIRNDTLFAEKTFATRALAIAAFHRLRDAAQEAEAAIMKGPM